jgi:hypothetical protein
MHPATPLSARSATAMQHTELTAGNQVMFGVLKQLMNLFIFSDSFDSVPVAPSYHLNALLLTPILNF